MIEQIKVLNLIRGIAATIVIISHYSNTTKLFDKLLGSGAGQLGVMLFFVLSGFLMSFLYLKSEFSKKEINNYIVARFARVVPLYLIIVLLSYFSTRFFDSNILYSISNNYSLLLHVFFIEGVSVLWTIPVEIQFYLIFIFLWLLYFINRIFLYFCIFLLIYFILFFNIPITFNVFGIDLEARIIQAIPYFSIGLLMGLIYKKIEVPTKYISSWWGLTILLIIVLYPNINYYLFYRVIDIWSDVFTYIGISLFFFCWVFLTPKTSKIYSNQFGSYLGMISYSLYLWHLPLLYFFKDLARKEALWFLPIYLILLIIMAFFSYKLIEKPARNIIRKWLIKPIKIN